MSLILIGLGILAAFSTGADKPDGYNLAMVILAIGCFACSAFMEYFEARNARLLEEAELKIKLEEAHEKRLIAEKSKLEIQNNKPEQKTEN